VSWGGCVQIGDNDNLAAMVSTMVGADLLILLTDVAGLFTASPSKDPTAKLIRTVPYNRLEQLRSRCERGEKLFDPSEFDEGGNLKELESDEGGNLKELESDEGGNLKELESDEGGNLKELESDEGGNLKELESAVEEASSESLLAAHVASASAAVSAAVARGGKASASGAWGTGGMATKLAAAQIATSSGARMVIMQSSALSTIGGCVDRDAFPESTLFQCPDWSLQGRHKRWLMGLSVKGEIVLDAGAVRAVVSLKKSLFAAGIVRVGGSFGPREVVHLLDEKGERVARALSEYSSSDLKAIKGLSSDRIEDRIRSMPTEYVCSRANIVILADME
jgi:glutamate 5-kinase